MHTHICTNPYAHTHTHTYIYIYAYAHIYIRTYIHVYIYIYIHTQTYTHTHTNIYIYLSNPSARAGYDTRSIFKRSLTGLNSEFSFSKTNCLIKAEEPSLPYYLPLAGGRIIGFIAFQRVLVLCEMQSVSSRIWTLIAVFISYDDNHYITGTYIYIYTHTNKYIYTLSYTLKFI